MAELTRARLGELFSYDPDTGIFARLADVRGGGRAGDVAGNDDGAGYLRIGIDGREYRCHVLAWLYMTGAMPLHLVDHKNQNRSDNRWRNLRAATKQQNLCNVKRNAANTSGYRGVYWDKQKGVWVAQIRVNYKNKRVGSFRDLIEAARARDAAAIRYHGEFAGLNFPA